MTVLEVQDKMDAASADLRRRMIGCETALAMRLAMSVYEAEMRTLVHLVIVDLRNEQTDKIMEASDRWAERCVKIAKEAVAIRDKPCT